MITVDSGVPAVETPKVETPKVDGQPQAAPKPQNPNNWAILARKEKALVQERQKFAEERAQAQREREELAAWRKEKADFEAKRSHYKQNPNDLLKDHGLTYQDLSEFQLNDQQPTPALLVKSLQEEIADLKTRLATEKTEEQQRQEALQAEQMQEVLNDFRGQIEAFTSSKPDEYELININEAHELVYDVVEDYFQKHGKILSIRKASDSVERFLENRADRIANAKKIQARLNAKGQAPADRREIKEPAPQTRTLSNSYTPTSAPVFGQTMKSEQDRLNRALAALDGKK